MDPKDLPEDHRKYLDMKENPKRVSNTSIFALVSALDVKMSERLAEVKTKQEIHGRLIHNLDGKISELDEKVELKVEKQNDKIHIVENDFNECQLKGVGIRARDDEAHRWIMRAMKLTIILSCGTLAFLFYHMGLPFLFP